MRRINRRRWEVSEVAVLLAMIADCKRRGVRNEWRKISAATGHTESSCVQRWHSEVAKARGREVTAEAERRAALIRQMKPPEPKHVPLKPRVENPAYGQTTSTAMLVMDAELRSRISELGITGGLLGDPAPGRSALDKKRMAAA